MGIAVFRRVSFRVLAALLIIIIFFLVSNGGALIAILGFQARFAEIAGIKLSGLIAASSFAKSSERIAANAPSLAFATTQMMRETVVDQIEDQVALLNTSLEQLKIAGITQDRFATLQAAKENMVGLLKPLDQQVRQQIDLDTRFALLLDQLRKDVSGLNSNPLLLTGSPDTDSGERTSDRASAERWTAHAYEAAAVMLAVAGSNDEFRLERLRSSFHQLWQRMEAAQPLPSTALTAVRDDILHLGMEPGSIFDLRIAQLRGRTAIQGALRANKRASSRLVSSAAEMFQLFDEDIQHENAFLRRWMFYYLIFFVAIGLFCTSVAAWLFIYIDQGVIRRLKSLQQCMQARVDLQPVAIPTSGHDEIAEMARATEHFITVIEHREELLNRIFEAAPIPITLVRMNDGRIMRANSRAIREFGLTLAPDCSATANYRDGLERSTFLEHLSQRGFVDGHEAKLASASSKTIYALLAGQLIESDGDICGLVGVTDISPLKEAEDAQRIARERAEEATIAKSRFLTNVSHELRTPLNAIIGLTEVLYDGAEHFGTEKAMEPLSRVIKAGRHLLQLINQILDIAKVEAGRMELVIEEVKIASLVDEVISTVALLAERNSNRISIAQDPDLTSLRTDRMRLRQILLNLLSNAARFTVRGDILVSVQREVAGGIDWIAFRVTDTGVGISEEHIGRLFEEFGQAGPSTGRQYGGTGLGLAISDRLCRLMGGRITVESKLGIGSTFVVHLPLSLA